MERALGVTEFDKLRRGTEADRKAVAESGAVSIVGGGDSAAAIERAWLCGQDYSYSTGGGASLEFLEGRFSPV